MWPLILIGLGAGVAALLYERGAKAAPTLPPASPAAPGEPAVTPGGVVPEAQPFPIPNTTQFTTAEVDGGGFAVTVAAFLPDTMHAMADALSAREWRVNGPLSDRILSIGPVDSTNAGSVDALSAIRAASAGGLNVFADADLAQKLAAEPGAPDPTQSDQFLCVDHGMPLPDPATDDGIVGPEQVARTTAQATEALSESFKFGSRFVLFVPAGVQV